MITRWRPAVMPLHAGETFAALLAVALGCAVASPAWSACPPGSSGANCTAPEPQRQPQVQEPRPQQYQPQVQQPRPQQYSPQVQQPRPQQFQPQVQQQQQFAPQRQPPAQAAPAQVYRPTPLTASPPVSAGAAVRPGSAVTGSAQLGGPPVRDNRAAAFAYHGQTYAPFRADRYRWPGGMHYRRYGVGAYLPLAFILGAYVIADWMDYGLAQPMPGYEWVRYGPDILLVDPNTGQIIDGAYSAVAESDDASPPGYAQAAPPYFPPPGYAGQPPQAAGPQTLGSYGNWVAAAYQENGQPVCYAVTQAIASTPSVPNRGAAVLTVTERPALRDAVSIGGIQTDAGGAGIMMQVGRAGLDFYPAGGAVFARNGAAAVAAFQAGSQAMVQSLSPYNGPVTDTFSLMGFSAAYAAISAACPMQ